MVIIITTRRCRVYCGHSGVCQGRRGQQDWSSRVSVSCHSQAVSTGQCPPGGHWSCQRAVALLSVAACHCHPATRQSPGDTQSSDPCVCAHSCCTACTCHWHCTSRHDSVCVCGFSLCQSVTVAAGAAGDTLTSPHCHLAASHAAPLAHDDSPCQTQLAVELV